LCQGSWCGKGTLGTPARLGPGMGKGPMVPLLAWDLPRGRDLSCQLLVIVMQGHILLLRKKSHIGNARGCIMGEPWSNCEIDALKAAYAKWKNPGVSKAATFPIFGQILKGSCVKGPAVTGRVRGRDPWSRLHALN
ncbi:hypothetical protein L195_g016712, partial [Trifolium pratense]